MKRVLLIQIRDDAMREHEYFAVQEKIGDIVSVVPFDIFSRLLVEEDFVSVDAIVVGGSGKYCVSEHEIQKEIENLEWFLREARARGIPMFAICFGHHLLAEALGGTVAQDRARQETGVCDVTVTDAGATDALFSSAPRVFGAQEGHKDHVTMLPPGAVLLASSALSPIQAFTFSGTLIYSVQFHPELSAHDVQTRLDFYASHYTRNGTSDAGHADSAVTPTRVEDTPEATSIFVAWAEAVANRSK